MNQQHQEILNYIEANLQLSEEDMEGLTELVKNADKALTIAEFKLERTEKVKRTTAILLEETIEELELKRKAIEKSNQALEKSLSELKSAQAQLIQSEKMASLGELTAGIAHEIQNPLNFVNNFSEVSSELIEDIDEELEEGEIDEVKAILKDIKENLLKINHHGKRADSIVKGMLQHSRNSSGEKEPTDINRLVEEYLNLAYHGLRAKDKAFSSNIETDFDKSIGKISIVPSDIGRVILNLINNAFYAVNEKREESSEGFKPKVEIISENHEKNVLIKVIDNGNGIPNSVVDKIFQPFFTTKPTGQGTGLGLSMSYDIIKAHGGQLLVNSQKNEGSVFTIKIPK